MIDPLIDAGDDAATPVTPEERDALIPSYVTLRRELNEIEQLCIQTADIWAFARKRDVLDEGFLRALHRRMFEQVWKWAGQYRKTSRNIGVDPWQIEPGLRQLLDDVRYWVDHKTFLPDEIALRFHRHLTWIHPFPNGNGRHARLATDLLIAGLGGERFTWGSGDLAAPDDVRRAYIEALRAADKHDLAPLLKFARS